MKIRKINMHFVFVLILMKVVDDRSSSIIIIIIYVLKTLIS